MSFMFSEHTFKHLQMAPGSSRSKGRDRPWIQKDGSVKGFIGPAIDIIEKAFNEEQRTFGMLMSEAKRDRARFGTKGKPAGDLIHPEGIDFADFARNSVILRMHSHWHWPLGSVIPDTIAVKGKKFVGDGQIAAAGVSGDADTAWGLIFARHLKAISVGIIPLKSEEIQDKDFEDSFFPPREIFESYLLEVSMVPVGMLQTALTRDANPHDFLELMLDVIGYNGGRDLNKEEVERIMAGFRRLVDDAIDLSDDGTTRNIDDDDDASGGSKSADELADGSGDETGKTETPPSGNGDGTAPAEKTGPTRIEILEMVEESNSALFSRLGI